MKRSIVFLALALFTLISASARADTLSKIANVGSASIGIARSNGPLSFPIDDGDVTGAAGFQLEICEWVLEGVKSRLGLQKLVIRYQPVAPGDNVSMLRSGAVDIDCDANVNTLARHRDAAFSLTTHVPDGAVRAPVAIMLRKDDVAFKKMVDDVLAAMMRSGDIAELHHKWFTGQGRPASERAVDAMPNSATLNAWARPNDRPAESLGRP